MRCSGFLEPTLFRQCCVSNPFSSIFAHRIARMVRQPRGNALLVGVGGTGKQSLTRYVGFLIIYFNPSKFL